MTAAAKIQLERVCHISFIDAVKIWNTWLFNKKARHTLVYIIPGF